jgi:hypothetical protein
LELLGLQNVLEENHVENVENLVENHAKREENQKRNLIENAKKVAVKDIKCVKKR